MGATNVFSGRITNDTLTISASQNVTRLSILCSEGAITFVGSTTFAGLPSTIVTFTVGQGVTLSAASASQPIDGVTIGAATGGDVVDVIISYQ